MFLARWIDVESLVPLLTEPVIKFRPLLLSLLLLLLVLSFPLLLKFLLLPFPVLLGFYLLLFSVYEVTPTFLTPVRVEALPVDIVGTHNPLGFLQAVRALICFSVIEVFPVGHAVSSGAPVARPVLLSSGPEEIEPVVKWVHVQEPVTLYPVATGAYVGQIFPHGRSAESALQRHAVLARELYFLCGKQILPQALAVDVPYGYVYVLAAIPAVGGSDSYCPQW